MVKKLTKEELAQQYDYRASLVSDIIGKWHGSGNRKAAQRVLKEPSRWLIWAMSLLRPLIPGSGKKHIRWTLLVPFAYLFSFAFVWWVRYIDKRNFTIKQYEDWWKSEVTKYLETEGLLDRLANPQTVAKYDRRIKLDPEYGNPDNLRSRAKETVITSLLSTPLDPDYPRFSIKARESKRWQRWFGLTPADSVWRVLWRVAKTGLYDSQSVAEIFAYWTARGIVRELGFDKGKGKDAIKAGIQAGIVQRGHTLKDEDGHVTEVLPDINSGREYDEVDNALMVDELFACVTDPIDSFALKLQYEAFQRGVTIEVVHQKHLKQCQRHGLNTSSAIKKRVSRLPTKYPVLSNFKP